MNETIGFIAVIIAIIGVGVTLGVGQSKTRQDITGIRQDITGIRQDITELRERMARLEGLFEGFTKRET